MIEIIKDSAPTSTKTTGKPDVVILLDASGSMSAHRESVVSTFNEYVQSVKDTASSISLYTFDSNAIREKIFKQSPSRVKKLTTADYKPDAMTPLYDAMGAVMSKFEDSDRSVQFVTHTDGAENDSKEWNYPKLKEYVEILTAKGWLFVYLGEGIQGQGEMAKFQGVKVNFTAHTRAAAMATLSASTQTYASAGTNDLKAYTSSSDGSINIKKDDKA